MKVTHIFSCERDRSRGHTKAGWESNVKGYFTMSFWIRPGD